MQMIILSIHLLVSMCLIGLVLLQRSEGGALGIGGGGGGALMSGRGASDALARLTAIAGGLFLAVSLALTWLSSAGDGPGRSVFDSLPAITAPAIVPEQAPPAEEPATAPDPTQSSAPSATELAANILPGPASASAAETVPSNAARAAPIEARPTSAPAQRTTAQQTPTTQRSTAPPPAAATQRTTGAQTQNASGTTTQRTTPPAQGAVTGVNLTEPTTPESVDLGNGVEAVRRERAGPDQ